MLLAFDVGNSNLTLGLYRDESLAEIWRIQTVHARSADEYGLLVRQFLQLGGYRTEDVDAVIIASVVPALTGTIEQLAERVFGVSAMIVGPGLKTGVSIRYDPPKDVGADRIVNAVAAYARVRAACIVVDFGTATTFDSITDQGEYAGGAIAPGIQISMEALFLRAAKLPRVDIIRPKSVVGRNTVESMQSGVFFGYVGLVDGLVRRMQAEMQERREPSLRGTPIRVLGTGGLAPIIQEASETIEQVDEGLTLEGLAMIYRMNRG
jgi:type III pantothenate kinase